MRKILVAAAAVAFLVPSAFASSSDAECAAGVGCCYWTADNCWAMNGTGDVSTPEQCTAASGVVVQSCSGQAPDKYCDWGTCVNGNGWDCDDGGCYSQSGKTDAQCTGQSGTLVDVCPCASLPPSALANRSDCGSTTPPTTTPPGGGDPYTPPSPTIALPTSAGLTVLANGSTLQILSSGAKVSLFDMNGTLVQSGAVSKGNSVFAISQKQGIYYAVVKAGSATQTVKVVVK